MAQHDTQIAVQAFPLCTLYSLCDVIPAMKHYLDAAEKAARAAGKLLRKNFRRPQRVNAVAAHDIKLEIDVQAQELITRLLLKEFPEARALR